MKRLTKSYRDRVIAGVCGGVADFFGIDATLVRIAWAALALFGGSGLLLYIVCALIMPADCGNYPTEQNRQNNSAQGQEWDRTQGQPFGSDGQDNSNGWR